MEFPGYAPNLTLPISPPGGYPLLPGKEAILSLEHRFSLALSLSLSLVGGLFAPYPPRPRQADLGAMRVRRPLAPSPERPHRESAT